MMTKGIFSHITNRIAAAPHRSVSGIPYGQLFGLYVRALKTYRQTSGSQRDSSQLRTAKHSLDVALLSSVVSQKWSEVVLPHGEPLDPTPSAPPEGVRWWRESAEGAWLNSAEKIRGIELVTAPFLAETLLSGHAIAAWTEAVQQSSTPCSWAPDSTREGLCQPHDRNGTLVVVVPFSALLQLRAEAFPTRNKTSLEGAKGAPQAELSLQERKARSATLQSLHQLMELQCSSSKRWTDVEIAVGSPVFEFDAIMQMSQVRSFFPEVARSRFTLATVCELEVIRSAYLAHYLTFTKKSISLSVLAPQSHYAELQKMAITSSCLKAKSACEIEVQRRSRLKNSLHKQAVNGCGELVRRMATREENLRQIMIP